MYVYNSHYLKREMKVFAIIFLGILLFVACVDSGNKNESHEIKEQTSSGTVNDTLLDLQKIARTYKPLELPLKFEVTEGLKIKPLQLKTSLTPFSLFGYFPDTSSTYSILTTEPGDYIYPIITTYSKAGQLIQRKIISTGNCSNPVADISNCYDSVVISNNYDILCHSILIGQMEDFSDTSSNPQMLDYCWLRSIKYQIQSSGLIDTVEYISKGCNK